MPFDDTSKARLLDDEGKVKYDLTTGKGRLAYLADQLEATQPAGFNMGSWQHCAIGEASKMQALRAVGIDRVKIDHDEFGAFFGISRENSMYLFCSHGRNVDTEVAAIRAVVSGEVGPKTYR